MKIPYPYDPAAYEALARANAASLPDADVCLECGSRHCDSDDDCIARQEVAALSAGCPRCWGAGCPHCLGN